jgi:hypothetical protein
MPAEDMLADAKWPPTRCPHANKWICANVQTD